MEVQDPGSQPLGNLAEIPSSAGQACLCHPCLEGLSELGDFKEQTGFWNGQHSHKEGRIWQSHQNLYLLVSFHPARGQRMWRNPDAWTSEYFHLAECCVQRQSVLAKMQCVQRNSQYGVGVREFGDYILALSLTSWRRAVSYCLSLHLYTMGIIMALASVTCIAQYLMINTCFFSSLTGSHSWTRCNNEKVISLKMERLRLNPTSASGWLYDPGQVPYYKNNHHQ